MTARPVVLVGDSAARIDTSGLDPRAVRDALRAVGGVHDVVITPTCACVYAPPERWTGEFVEVLGAAIRRSEMATTQERTLAIEVRFDGEDLPHVADRLGLTTERVIERVLQSPFCVAMIGFMPGFAYLQGLAPSLHVSRRSSPRPRVPAKAFAIAGPYAGIYPFASPGGWNLIGTAVSFVPFRADSGAAWDVGDRVQIVRG